MKDKRFCQVGPGLFFVLLTFAHLSSNSQDSALTKPLVSWDMYAETYYAYELNEPPAHRRTSFIYNHDRHNEFNVNLALARIAYTNGKARANIGIMAGTYPAANLGAEPGLLQHIYEANIGLKMSKDKEYWLDAGILPSHIGFETAIGKDCPTLTRSIAAENSPYYEAGIRISYKTTDQKWYLAGLLLNGWQRISHPEGNNTPAFGSQIQFITPGKSSFNLSSFVGNDKPDSARRWRYFNNLYVSIPASKTIGFTLGFDLGFEQESKGSPLMNSWYTPVFILRYHKNSWALAGRAEYFSDKTGILIPLVNDQPFRMQGYSLNLDREFGENLLWRIEGKWFRNATPYFLKGTHLERDAVSITTSLSISF